MASETVSVNEEVETFDRTRIALASEALGEIESILCLLKRELVNDPDSNCFEYSLRMCLRRLGELHTVAHSVVAQDDMVTNEDLRQLVIGAGQMELSHG